MIQSKDRRKDMKYVKPEMEIVALIECVLTGLSGVENDDNPGNAAPVIPGGGDM